MKNLLFAAVLLTACGPDFEGGGSDCLGCRNGEISAESVDGGQQIPIIVNVTVIVNQDQNQRINWTSGTYPRVPVLTWGDAGAGTGTGTGTGTATDAGQTQDSGSTVDAGCQSECRLVCVEYVERQHCDQGWHGTDTKGRCRPHPHSERKCVKEVLQCS